MTVLSPSITYENLKIFKKSSHYLPFAESWWNVTLLAVRDSNYPVHRNLNLKNVILFLLWTNLCVNAHVLLVGKDAVHH